MAQKLLVTAHALLVRFLRQPSPDASLTEIVSLLHLASTLGRRATDLDKPETEDAESGARAMSPEVEAALHRIYGQPGPGEIQ